jgi:hypothetical protein
MSDSDISFVVGVWVGRLCGVLIAWVNAKVRADD